MVFTCELGKLHLFVLYFWLKNAIKKITTSLFVLHNIKEENVNVNNLETDLLDKRKIFFISIDGDIAFEILFEIVQKDKTLEERVKI